MHLNILPSIMTNKIIRSRREKCITRLLDIHVFQDSEYKIGSTILELGRLDTLVLTLSKNQSIKNLQQIPDNHGSTLYRLLTDPDNVNLEYLSADLFAVSIHYSRDMKILNLYSILKYQYSYKGYVTCFTETDETDKTDIAFLIRGEFVIKIRIYGDTGTAIDF